MDDRRLARELRALKLYAAVSTGVMLVLSLAAFRREQPTKFTEIDVERINVVEPDGKLRMVISNRPRSIPPIYKGKPYPGTAGGGRPGILFFNDEGSENGGLGFSGQRGADGKYRASAQLAFDQFDQDQILYMSYADQNGVRRTGLTVADRADASLFEVIAARDSLAKLPASPARDSAMQRLMGPRDGVPMFAQRLFLGRDPSKNAIVNLSDPQGKPRLRLVVDSTGRASVQFLDADGRVTYSLPDSARR